jgi:dipeptide/tripeptide permease
VAVIVVLFLFAAIFWSAFEQAPTSLNLFAKDFTNRSFFGWEMPATWFQSINSAFIILLAPLFAALWVGLGRRRGDLSSPAKFSLGLFFAGVGFLLMIPAARGWWQQRLAEGVGDVAGGELLLPDRGRALPEPGGALVDDQAERRASTWAR